MRRLVLTLLLALGCAGGGIGAVAAENAMPSSTLLVMNGYREPVHVYIEHAGTRTRSLGVVESYGSRLVALQRSDFYASALQLLIIAYTDGTTVRTDAVPVGDGQSLALEIGPMRGQQFLYIRPRGTP